MNSNKSNELKSNQRNILALGSSDKTSFIQTFKEFGSNNCTYHNQQVLGYTPKCVGVRTSEITPVDFTIFGEQLNFIDIPEECKISMIYEAMKSFNVVNIDAILIFIDQFFDKLETYYEDFFKLTVDLPIERIIIIVTCKTGTKNRIVTAVNLEREFMCMSMRMTMSLNENLFLFEDEFYSHHTMQCFFNRLKYLFNLPPSTYQFTVDIPKLLKEIPELFCTLIEVLHQIDVLSNTSEDEDFQRLYIYPFRDTATKESIKGKTFSSCCYPCECSSQELNNEIIYCTKLHSGVCTICSKSAAEHIITRCNVMGTKVEFKRDQDDTLRFEKQSILHLMATLYHFCKLRYGLPDACKNFKKAYWSVAKLDDVSSEDPIYEELEETIKDYESNFHQPTPEEMVLLIEHFLEDNWTSFRISCGNAFIQTNCKLTFLPANTPECGSTSKLTRQATSNQKQLRFPEMKVKLPRHHANPSALTGDITLEDLRKELNELKEQKISTDREITELKQQIEGLKKQMN